MLYNKKGGSIMRIINSFVIRFNNLKLWQKILLAIGLLAISRILLGTGCINVKAESYTNPNVIMSDSINGANINVNDINSNNLYKSNWVSQENIDYFKELNKDGKNIRGVLVNLGYNLLKEDKKSTPLALAYEIFQTSILVHDDIIDKDEARREKETIHHRNEKNYKKGNLESRKHLSNSIAL